MIRYQYRHARLLFVGINPHHGSFARGIPFSNNKSLWYLLNRAGLIDERTEDLRRDATLRYIYEHKFSPVYRLGIVNVVDRPSTGVAELRRGEEANGRAAITRIARAV